ncbi:MAG: hypothetical protein JF609_05760 [Verrucomicrobia bacterium]|nr:hypothetical protein [Verrucomicrobiota bacterium]
MFTNDAFLNRAITAFLTPVIWSAICYFAISFISQIHPASPRDIYVRRLVLMFIVTLVWSMLYPALGSAFIGNSADPRNEERHALWVAKELGMGYGVHVIWAWLLIALIDKPKLRPNTALEPTAIGVGSPPNAGDDPSRRGSAFGR